MTGGVRCRVAEAGRGIVNTYCFNSALDMPRLATRALGLQGQAGAVRPRRRLPGRARRLPGPAAADGHGRRALAVRPGPPAARRLRAAGPAQPAGHLHLHQPVLAGAPGRAVLLYLCLLFVHGTVGPACLRLPACTSPAVPIPAATAGQECARCLHAVRPGALLRTAQPVQRWPRPPACANPAAPMPTATAGQGCV